MDDSQATTASNPLRQQYTQYSRQLLFDLGLDDLPDPERSRFLATLDKYVSQIITNTILKNIDDQTAKVISEMLEKGEEQDDILAYAISASPEIETKISEALNEGYEHLKLESRALTAAIADKYRDAVISAQKKSKDEQPSASQDTSPTDQTQD